jgi:hypothetical protein
MGGCERSFAGRLWKTLGFLVFKAKKLGVSKKTEKPSKLRKKTTKKTVPKKKPIKPIIFFVKIFGLVRFRFTKPETGKTPTEPNWFGLRGSINTEKKNTQ